MSETAATSTTAAAPPPKFVAEDDLAPLIRSLLAPTESVAAKIQNAVAVQASLKLRIDELSNALQQAASAGAQAMVPAPDIERQLARLRNCRARIAKVQQSFVATKGRLVKVQAHLSAQAAVAERQNAATESALNAALPPDATHDSGAAVAA